ncbi:MAG: carboxypeptidase-like regulatory domain-containing protein [Planctomycetota bacterium]
MRNVVFWLFLIFIVSIVLNAIITPGVTYNSSASTPAERDSTINNTHRSISPGNATKTGRSLELARREDTQSHATLQKGWFIEGRIAGAANEVKANIYISTASVDPADALEITDPERASEVWNFTNYRFITITNGEFGPVWIDAAEGYCIVGVIGEREIRWRAPAPANIQFGSTWNVGILESIPSTSLSIQLAGPANIATFQLKLARVAPTEAGSRKYHELLAIDRPLAEAVYNGSEIAIINNQTTILQRLPDAGEWDLVLVSPTGIESKPRRVFLHEGLKNNITMDARAEFSTADLEPATIRGRVQFETGESVANAQVAEFRSRISARTAADGSFTLSNAPRGREISLVITNFDAARPTREFVYITIVEPSAAEHNVIIGIPPQRWISARGLEKPWGLPYEEPLAFYIEKMSEGAWKIYNSEIYEKKAGGVDVAVGSDETTYRVGALWTPLYIQYSMPATIPKGNTSVATTFLPIPPADALSGFVMNEKKQKEPDAFIEIQGPVAGVPPLELRSGGEGEFRIFPVNVSVATLRCHSKSGVAEMELILPLEKPAQVVVHP